MTRDRGVRSPLEDARREEALADWLADRRLDAQLADALGEVRKSDGAPRVLGNERVLECVQELRDEHEHLAADLERADKDLAAAKSRLDATQSALRHAVETNDQLRAELKIARIRELNDQGTIAALNAEIKHAQRALQDALLVGGGG